MNIHDKFQLKPYGMIVTVFFALITITVLGAVGTFASAGEINRLSRPSVRADFEIDYPPFCIVDKDGRATGFSVELMRAALDAMGRDVTFRTAGITKLPIVGRIIMNVLPAKQKVRETLDR